MCISSVDGDGTDHPARGKAGQGKESAKTLRLQGDACHRGQMRVLLVEDDDAIAEPLATGLRRDGFDVTRVATAAAALEGRGFDVVLLDLGLPDRDGYDLCRDLRSRSDVPIIVVTARSDEVDRVLGLEL